MANNFKTTKKPIDTKNGEFYSIEEDLCKLPDDFYLAFLASSRSTGKTTSALWYAYQRWVEDPSFKLYLIRRTGKEVTNLSCSWRRKVSTTGELIDGTTNSPFNSIRNLKQGKKIPPIGAFKISEGISAFYVVEDGEPNVNKCLGYLLSLQHIGTCKSMPAIECPNGNGLILMDECLAVQGTWSSNDEFKQFADLIVTIDRNFHNIPVVLMTNSTTMSSDLMRGFGITPILSKMIVDGDTVHYEKGMYIHLIAPSEQRKASYKNSGLYKLLDGTDYVGYAFADEGFSSICDFSSIKPKSECGLSSLDSGEHLLTFKIQQGQTYEIKRYVNFTGKSQYLFYIEKVNDNSNTNLDLTKDNDSWTFKCLHQSQIRNQIRLNNCFCEDYNVYDYIMNKF